MIKLHSVREICQAGASAALASGACLGIRIFEPQKPGVQENAGKTGFPALHRGLSHPRFSRKAHNTFSGANEYRRRWMAEPSAIRPPLCGKEPAAVGQCCPLPPAPRRPYRL